MKRRSFFKKLSAIVAAVAIAPEVAFRAKLELPKLEKFPIVNYFVGENTALQFQQVNVYDFVMSGDFQRVKLDGWDGEILFKTEVKGA